MSVSSGKVVWRPLISPVMPQQAGAAKAAAPSGFSEMLKQEMKEPDVSFSSHALDRLRQRNILLQPENVMRLSDAVDRAQDKGAQEALVLDSNIAYVVSVKNRAVITVMDRNQMQDHVFTNIDSAVIL